MIDMAILQQYFPALRWRLSEPRYNEKRQLMRHEAHGYTIDPLGNELAYCYVGLDVRDDGINDWECDFHLLDRDNFNAVHFGYSFPDQAECLHWLRTQLAKTANMLTLTLLDEAMVPLPDLQQRRDQIIAKASPETETLVKEFWDGWRNKPQELQASPPSGQQLLAIDLQKVDSHEGLYIAHHFQFNPQPVRLIPYEQPYHAYALLYYGPIETAPADLQSRYEQMCKLIHPAAIVFLDG